MEKSKYESPLCTFTAFKVEDIITEGKSSKLPELPTYDDYFVEDDGYEPQ